MRDKLAPWLPAICCAALSLITVVADVVGRFLTGAGNSGLTAFLCFMPMCFFHVGVMLKRLQDENRTLKQRIDEVLLEQDDRRNMA